MATTQFCLTDPGTNLVGPTVSLLSDVDNFTTTFQTGVSLSSLQPPNCPAILTVPNTATQIRVFDQESNSCATVNLQGNDLCTLFNLSITELQTQTISQIIIGDFTTSFGPVTDYLIYWYRNGESTPQYITGKGNLFTGYIASHPLTGGQALLAQSGEYSIRIAKMQINGVNFSTLDTPEDGFVKVTTSCIPSVLVTVTALNCNNGTFTSTDNFYSGYSHKYSFDNAAVGTTPQALSTTFDLSLTTNYLAFMFEGKSISDTLKITFIGGAYSDPIVLEYLQLGGDVANLTSPNLVPKKVTSDKLYKKILTLTSLDRTIDDYLIIEIIPNQTNNQTIWSLYLKCLSSVDCTHCTDQYINQPYKLKGGVDTYTTLQTCNSFSVNSQIEACSQSSFFNTDIYRYLSFDGGNWTNPSVLCTTCTGPFLRTINQVGLNASIRTCNSSGAGVNQTCGPNPSGTVQISSTVNSENLSLTITFSNTANFTNFLNNFTNSLTTQRSNFPNYLDPLNSHYYRYIQFQFPNGQGCGDAVPTSTLFLPLWLNYTSTSNSLTISYSSISQDSLQSFQTANSFTNCDVNCLGSSSTIRNNFNNQISNYSTNPLNYINNSGGYYSQPFSPYGGLNIVGPDIVTKKFSSNYLFIQAYQNCTYMFSGDPLTLINVTPIKACNFELIGGWPLSTNLNYTINSNLGTHNRYLYEYLLTPRVPYNPTYPDDFTIEGKVPTNGVLGAYQFAYQKLNGVVTTSSTFII